MWSLKYHGKLSMPEMCLMTAEDRKWWVKRLKKHFEDQEKASKNNNSGGGPPGKMPSR
jgi:hypothetical protein